MLSVYFKNCKIYVQKVRPNTWTKHIGYNICITGKKCISYFQPIMETGKNNGISLKYKYNSFQQIKKRYKNV